MAGVGRAQGRNRREARRDVVTAPPAAVSSEQPVHSAPRWVQISAFLALIGVVVSLYLTFVHYDEGALICGIGDCHTVQNSRYAEVAGIPIAILGLLMYATVLALAVYRWRHPSTSLADTLTSVAFAIALAGVGYAAYLTWLEIAVIHAICQWCVVSAILIAGLFLTEGYAVWRMLGDHSGRL